MGTAAVLWLGSDVARAATVVVRPGDTLSRLAARYGTTVAAIAESNRIADPDVVYAGRRLIIPAAPSSAHVVRAGETLSEIAARLGTTVSALARANDLDDPNLIRVGQRLRVAAVSQSAGAAQSRFVSPPAGAVDSLLAVHAAGHGVDSALVKAVAWQESGWQQPARSPKGAVGVMQVMPATARFVNRSLGGGRLRLHAASDNIHLGVMYLRYLLDRMGSESRALAAYYSGPGRVGARLEPYQRQYVRSVRALKERFR